jgi:hypothetical protein
MLTFADLAIGDRFQKAGYTFTKRTEATAVDYYGGIATIGPDAWVDRITNIATKPDILKQPEPTHETRITRLTITPNKFPLYCEEGLNIELMDEAAGEFVRVSGTHEGELKIDPSEWPLLRKAIDRMILICRKDHNED